MGFTGNYTAAVWLGNDDFSQTRNMTGGTLPAMVWQRLMVYAHQNIDLKPTPGLDKPFIDEEIAAKAEEAEKKNADQAAADAAAERPAVLSSRTTQTLRDMTRLFQSAPALSTPQPPETLSAL